jgi:hypothetical protein
MHSVSFARLVCAAALWSTAAAQDQDPAIAAAREDLTAALASIGRAASGSELQVRLDPAALSAEASEWTPDGGRLLLRAGSALGAAYAIERIAWLTRGLRSFPPPAGSDRPILPYRFYITRPLVADSLEGPPAEPADIARSAHEFRQRLRDALRFGYNYVVIAGLEHYVPSEGAPYAERSERYRRHLRAALREAHAHHLKVLLIGDEAIYLPSWLAAAGARASVKDPGFWDALQDKYRRLLRAVPDLDGVATRIGEFLPGHGFESLDLIHSREPEPDPRIEERYRTFLTKIHQVVSGEFGKIFLHRTWVTNDWEQHSVPEVYRRTFTAALPADNLFVAIKLTKQDAWYYGSAFNPTFGQTPHRTIAQAELYSQYHGLGTVADFPARWMGAALEWATERGAQGVLTTQPLANLLSPGILYVFSRLSWNPKAGVRETAREWVAATFGPAGADELTSLLLDSAETARHMYYLPPVALDGWDPLPAIRVDKFVAKGNPRWDQGRGHDEFLRSLYLKLKPYFDDTYAQASRGFDLAAKMQADFGRLRERLDPSPQAAKFEEILRHTTAVAALTRDYTRTMLSYFAYREQPSAATRERLEADSAKLKASAAAYRQAHRFYDLAGIDRTLELAARMLQDRERAEQVLRDAPTEQQIAARFREARAEDQRLLDGNPQAELILRWKGTIDGRDILHIRDSQIRVEPVSGDGVHAVTARFARPVPQVAGGRWAIRPVSVRGVAYVMTPPGPDNDFTLSIYLDDPDAGSGVFDFEVYRIP